MSIELETSYGGVVVRGDDVLVITPAGRHVTGLPKGGLEAGETPEQAAAREVREETGVEAAVREPLGDVRYTYRRDGRRVRKTVHFFLCEYVAGSTSDHDHEVDDARWIAISGARQELTYPGERALIDTLLSKMACGR
ncbi:NUDIX hydrolase [Candidatus Solirubrobacter pratensis]|jgi:8-oxo-dGTP pyrophosphatase MutT (NUDIX family)|uniref:NUDIX hydrolase n=1 Tax=Candidatus Solirubrobacter pratensis TaxID=1298857 RepID=UPI000420EBFA|nr:NUDIX hydrolase [Candidatus Solirubrobacter pratensis]